MSHMKVEKQELSQIYPSCVLDDLHGEFIIESLKPEHCLASMLNHLMLQKPLPVFSYDFFPRLQCR